MAKDAESSAVTESIVLGKYYAWRGGSGIRDEYSYNIVRFKRGDHQARGYFVGRVARAIIERADLNRSSCVLVPVPSSKPYDPMKPHRGELLCKDVAAVPTIRLGYGNYVIRSKEIASSHGRSVATRPPVEEHLNTLEIRIPHASGRLGVRLGIDQWKKIDVVLFDDVRYLGNTSEACARLLLQAGFRRVYAIFLGQNQP